MGNKRFKEILLIIMKNITSMGTLLLALATFILAFYAFQTFKLTLEQDENLNRPYIGLANNNIEQGFHSTSSSSIILVSIKNYGSLPAYFKVDFKHGLGYTKSWQSDEDYIMPGQGINLKWNIYFDKVNIEDNDICKALENTTFTIKYGLNYNETKFATEVVTKLIEVPMERGYLPNEDEYFRVLVLRCGGISEKENLALVWYIKNMR